MKTVKHVMITLVQPDKSVPFIEHMNKSVPFIEHILATGKLLYKAAYML